MWDHDWAEHARCTGTGDDLFVVGAEQHLAKRICLACPVKTECLAEALDHHLEWGIWGGATEMQRRALLIRKPNVPSWRAVLEAARDHALTA